MATWAGEKKFSKVDLFVYKCNIELRTFDTEFLLSSGIVLEFLTVSVHGVMLSSQVEA